MSLQQNRWLLIKFKALTTEVLGCNPPYTAINEFIKKKQRYSFKRGSSRVPTSKRKESPYIQNIFWSKILKELHKNNLWINIDESTFSRSVKCNYSWLPKGQNYSIINTNWKGSTSMIFALLSNGKWIWILKNVAVDSEDFITFLLILEAYLSKWINIGINSTWVTLDNAATHTSRKTKFAAKKLNFRLNYLPTYSPTLAPVELVFGILKRKIASQRKCKTIDFRKKSGKEVIIDALDSISSALGTKLWIRFVKEAKKWVINWKERQTRTLAA